ncbi:hypothetical protein NDU88_000735 [Pleurodeles waltl]|uniref:Uncharacterized protein n=1 Tax=Pleurodeles waltl TaxID=8319 RepID=A0AAV7P1V5_PLEWA|nr:hypothetical protein NDU88_000735 [Pleurodeles waltl]
MQVSQVCGDVAVAGYVEDEAGRGVLDALQAVLEFGGGPGVEGVAVVQATRDKGVGHGFSGVGGDPAEDLAEHAESEEAGGGHGVDLLGHGEKRVQDEAEVAGVVCGGRCGAEGRGPPGVVPGGRGVGLGAGGVLGEGEYKLGVVGVGGDDDVVLAYDVGEGAHVDIEECRAER